MSSSQIWLGFHFASAYKEVAEETKDSCVSFRKSLDTQERSQIFLLMVMAFTGAEFYSVMVGVVPLYVAMFLGYGSLRWWKLVQVPEQCVGIAQLNTYFLLPAYVCHFLAFNNPYNLSLRILAADFLSKAVLLC
jgi:hypothetical protein